ncbi:hypothetical protein [Bacillus sp. FJAT-22090]|uniref:hypothetical protein n=1 Tax=Bacillus sp. FJAT-22090 TaxID=1581038 RepID=UPI0011A02D6D|nr:hypothetical protein [Bacillus sp. FJAT-22090]
MSPTVIERNPLTSSAAHEYMKKMVEMDQLVTAALVKNLLFTVKGAEHYSREWKEEDLFNNKEMLVECVFKLFQHISEESARDSTPAFSTTEVAKYIGISPQTINT